MRPPADGFPTSDNDYYVNSWGAVEQARVRDGVGFVHHDA
jgi:hypothetical protein